MLKNLISSLLSRFYSKAESDVIAHCAMPSSTTILIDPDSGQAFNDEYQVTFTAPVSGYVYQQVENKRGLERSFSLITNRTAGISTQGNSYKTYASRVICPCSKGDTILCGRPTDILASEVIIRVSTAVGQTIKDIGGGYNSFTEQFRRVCACLKSLFLSCWKNFSTPSDLGLQRPRILQPLQTPSLSLRKSQANGLASRPPFLGTFVSELGPRICCSAMGTYGRAQTIMSLLIKATHCLATRAARSRIRYRSMPVRYTFSLPRTWQIQCDFKRSAL